MRTELALRRHEFAARMLLAELGIGNIAAVTIRITEMLRYFRDVIELVGRHVVAEYIAAVVREPKLFRPRIPIEAHGIAHTARDDFAAGAVGIHPFDVRVAFRIDLADVTRSTDVYIELAIGTEGDEFAAVMCIRRQLVRHDNRLRRRLQSAFNIVEAQNAID